MRQRTAGRIGLSPGGGLGILQTVKGDGNIRDPVGRGHTALISTVKGENNIRTRVARGAADSWTRCKEYKTLWPHVLRAARECRPREGMTGILDRVTWGAADPCPRQSTTRQIRPSVARGVLEYCAPHTPIRKASISRSVGRPQCWPAGTRPRWTLVRRIFCLRHARLPPRIRFQHASETRR